MTKNSKAARTEYTPRELAAMNSENSGDAQQTAGVIRARGRVAEKRGKESDKDNNRKK